VELAVAVGRAFRQSGDPPTAERLADLLDEPVRMVRRLLQELERAEIVRSVVPLQDEDAGFVPAAPLADLTVGEILRGVRGVVSVKTQSGEARDPSVFRTLGRLERAWAEIADQTSLASLAGSAGSGAESEGV
jgi:DNA-binding IscR family transcriptional regulator